MDKSGIEIVDRPQTNLTAFRGSRSVLAQAGLSCAQPMWWGEVSCSPNTILFRRQRGMRI